MTIYIVPHTYTCVYFFIELSIFRWCVILLSREENVMEYENAILITIRSAQGNHITI